MAKSSYYGTIRILAAVSFVVVTAIPESAHSGDKIDLIGAQSKYQSAWAKNPFSGARLLAATVTGNAHRPYANLGVQIKMKPGWKTYWRSPGDSGVPPQFAWQGSENLADARVLWPAPTRFKDEYGQSIGYKDKVVFPVHVRALDPGKQIKVSLNFGYAVCKEICVPVQAKLKLVLSPSGGLASPHASLIGRYAARVPELGASKNSARAVGVTRAPGAKPAVLVDIRPGVNSADAKVFVEGPATFFFNAPTPLPHPDPALRRYRFAVDGVTPEKPLKNAPLKITIVAADHASEQTLKLK